MMCFKCDIVGAVEVAECNPNMTIIADIVRVKHGKDKLIQKVGTVYQYVRGDAPSSTEIELVCSVLAARSIFNGLGVWHHGPLRSSQDATQDSAMGIYRIFLVVHCLKARPFRTDKLC